MTHRRGEAEVDGRSKKCRPTGDPADGSVLAGVECPRRVSNGLPTVPITAAGFPVPRPPTEIIGSTAQLVLAGNGWVEEDNGSDVTDAFIEGARLAVERSVAEGCVMAVLTDGSPSFGTTYAYDGTFSGDTIEGMGVTAQLLHNHGLPVFPEDRIKDAGDYLRSLAD